MEDKIRLLMEETGCDRGEAELALSSAGYNVERAIRTIPTLLRNIVVLKAKFQAVQAHVYGLFLVIADIRHSRLFRVRAVTSYNPSLYETDLERDWYDFERELYVHRLMEGAHPSLTKELEILLNDFWASGADNLYSLLQSGDMDTMHHEFNEFFERKLQWPQVRLELNREELNLAQFQQLRREGLDPGNSEPSRGRLTEESFKLPLDLTVELEVDPQGIAASEIKPGDTVFSIISDERDIAQYISRLLGGRSGDTPLSLPTPVEILAQEGDLVKFSLRLTTGIIGQASIPASYRLKTQRHSNASWWKRLFSWTRT